MEEKSTIVNYLFFLLIKKSKYFTPVEKICTAQREYLIYLNK